MLAPYFSTILANSQVSNPTRGALPVRTTLGLDLAAILRLLLLLIVTCLLGIEPSVPQVKSAGAQALQLGVDLVSLRRHAVGLFGLGPEAGHGEPLVQVGSEVEHDADREHEVHAELFSSPAAGRAG